MTDPGPVRRSLALFVALSLVLTAVISGVPATTQPAAAIHDCDSLDAAIYGFSFGHINSNKCSENHVAHAVEEVKESEDEQTKLDIYAAAVDQSSRHDHTDDLFTNYLQDSENAAWMHVEKAVAQEYENGSTQTQAKLEAQSTVRDYYTTKQINIIEAWNASATAAKYLKNRAVIEDGIADNYVYMDDSDLTEDFNIEGTTTHNITLINGTEKEVVAMIVNKTSSGQYHLYNVTPAGWNTMEDGGLSWSPVNNDGVTVRPPDTDYTGDNFFPFGPFQGRWSDVDTLNSNLVNDAGQFVDATWEDLEAGALDSTDIISRTTAMFGYGTEAQDPANRSFSDIIAATAGMGIETPQLNNTGVMKVQYRGENFTGMLFGDPPGDMWEVNTTYDTATFSEPVLLGTTDARMLELDGEFEILEMTDKSGNQTDSINTTDYVYQTSNTTALNEQLQELADLQREIEDREPEYASGGSGADLGLDALALAGLSGWVVLIGGIILLVVVLGGGGSGGATVVSRNRGRD